MDSLLAQMHSSNSMILLSDTEADISIDNSQGTQVLPCKRVLASTPWKRQRDEILFTFLKQQHARSSKPVLVLVNSVLEVNLFTATLRAHFPDAPDSAFKAIGTNLPVSHLKTAIHDHQQPANNLNFDFLILSAPVALPAFVHGIIQLQQFSLLCFADARGANQNHPFCVIMNHFYTALRKTEDFSCPRVIGFSDLKPESEIEKDMFSRRDWIRALKHFAHTFHCTPRSINPTDISRYLEDFPDAPLFDPLSIYETASMLAAADNNSVRVTSLDISDQITMPIVHLNHETAFNEIPRLIEFLRAIRKQFPQVKRVIHTPQPSAQFSAQLSLYACLQNLSVAPDPETAPALCKSASSLFSQSSHFLALSQGIDRIVRNPLTGSLLIESTAIPILVRACTLLARQFRQSSANETIFFKTLRVFPADADGKRTSTQSSHLSLLRLPVFFYERIKDKIEQIPAAEHGNFHLQGPLVASRHQAQCCAAFEAARLLITAGILDDNLLLSPEFRKLEDEDVTADLDELEVEDMEISGSDSSSSSNDPAALSFNEVIPAKLLLTDNTKCLHIYALEYELKMHGTAEDPFGLDSEPVLLTPLSRLLLSAIPSVHFFSSAKSSRTWSVLLPAALPDTFVPIEIPLGADHFLKTKLRRIGTLPLASKEYQTLLNSQQTLFGMFNMKPITVPDVNNTVLNVSDPVIHVPKDKEPFYLIAPLTCCEQGDFELTAIDSIPQVWRLFRSFVDSFKASPLEGTLYRPASKDDTVKQDWRIDWELCESATQSSAQCSLLEYLEALDEFIAAQNESSGELSVQLEEGGMPVDFKRFALERLAFLTPHTKIFYRSNRPSSTTAIDPVYPSSPFTSSAYPQVTTHAQYVQARYHLEVTNMEREMVPAKRIENWSDLAVWISADGATKKRRKKTQQQPANSNSTASSSTTSFIIPELARIFPTSYSTFRLAMLLPRVTFEIERQLRISQFFDDCLPATLPRPLHLRQVEALTASTAALSYSYEQLEVLGDSFLKYYSTLDTLLVGAGWSEGRLSSHRQLILCNANLRKAAEMLKITTYASFTPFFAKLWCPPPLPVDSSGDLLSQAVDRVLFSPEERWKALSVVEGKQVQKQAVYLLNPAGRLTIDENYKTKEQAKNSTDAIYKYGLLIPPKSLADIVEALIGIYYIDCGPLGALQFLIHCNILLPQILTFRTLNPLNILCGGSNKDEVLKLQQAEQIEKLKRRKLTPMTQIILDNLDNERTASSSSVSVQEAQNIPVPVNQIVNNVQPYAPPFSSFPFPALYAGLQHSFTHPELLFMACTHTSVDAKLSNEKLEWIGDAAIDWIVCRHYWYNYRISSELGDGERDFESERGDFESESNVITADSHNRDTATLKHPARAHVPRGYLPLSPEALTNSRQAAINNEAFARLVIKHNFHKFLRINSPHLQIEIERFASELRKENSLDSATDCINHSHSDTPSVLEQLHTHVSVAAPKVLGDLFEALMGAVLLDSNFDIDLFARIFAPFLTTICFDPASLPINAIQTTLHLYARLGIPRHQIVCTYKDIDNANNSNLGTICQVWVRERCVAEAEGSNKLVAKKIAMERALKQLEQDCDSV